MVESKCFSKDSNASGKASPGRASSAIKAYKTRFFGQTRDLTAYHL